MNILEITLAHLTPRPSDLNAKESPESLIGLFESHISYFIIIRLWLENLVLGMLGLTPNFYFLTVGFDF